MATHVNAFKDEARKALEDAKAAVQTAADKVEALVTRYEQDENDDVQPDTTTEETPAEAPDVKETPAPKKK